MSCTHHTADVCPGASVGEGTKIWNQSQIREGAVLGAGCVIGKNVYVDAGVKIGRRVKIQNNVSVYHGVTVEDDVFIGPSAVFSNDMYPRAFSEEWEVVPTVVKKGASIGANATIRCGVTIGEYAMIGAGSVVTKDVPAYALMLGNPARRVGTVCRCGMKVDATGRCPRCSGKSHQSTGEGDATS